MVKDTNLEAKFVILARKVRILKFFKTLNYAWGESQRLCLGPRIKSRIWGSFHKFSGKICNPGETLNYAWGSQRLCLAQESRVEFGAVSTNLVQNIISQNGFVDILLKICVCFEGSPKTPFGRRIQEPGLEHLPEIESKV